MPNNFKKEISLFKNDKIEKEADVFFIYPTLIDRKSQKEWNSNIWNQEIRNDVINRPVKYQASAWIDAGNLYVPFYRQAHIRVFNKKFKNPIGLAAGFDKSAEVYNSLFKFGFGFIEVGTVTPKRQLGNPKPRIFRLEKDQALINRLGFNNHGSEIIFKRISENQPDGFLGINLSLIHI